MRNQSYYASHFSTKKYIKKTWIGIRDFFAQYTGSLPALRERLKLDQQDITDLTAALASYEQYTALIAELEAFLKGVRGARCLLVMQKDSGPVPVPDAQYLLTLLAQLTPARGGMLYLEDKLTSIILHNPLHTRADLDLLGVTYQPTRQPDPAKSVGRIYPLFTGGKVAVHWTLPHGLTNARVTRSINHGPLELVYQGSGNTCADFHPIPGQSQVWAYTLTPLRHGELYGKPITEKIIVGSDIAVEEEGI
ncbi:MAG: hypothetical protein LBK71_09040 [Verrucomicrobiales bacterium]|jgi:hypothetical protein|nr:hypothetical protein [Verrucomicrobiales bacterium]